MKAKPATERIIFTGAGGVGKTTLAKAVADSLGYAFIPELGRKICHELGYEHINEIEDQEGFKRQVALAQIEAEEKLKCFVADRSTFDLWVLWQRWNICSAMTYDTESFYELCRAQAKNYTHVVYLPPMFVPEDDGLRWTDGDYQKQLDRIVRMSLYEWGLWEITYTVQTEGEESRLHEVLSWLK